MQNIDILGELERLAASFPWDSVDLWVKREPEGSLDFTAYVRDNPKFGFKSIFGSGPTAEAAVDDAIKIADSAPLKRAPEACRQAKIKELQEQVAKLMSVEIGLPPYIPNRELAQYVNRTVDV